MTTVIYNSPNRLRIGANLPVRVNLSFGAEKASAASREIEKIKEIISGHACPDILMDLSTDVIDPEPWSAIRPLFSGPIGVLPHYTLLSEAHGLDATSLLERIENVLFKGANFITIHCSPSRRLFEFACRKRKTPITSRGGGVVIRDMLLNERDESIFATIFHDICAIARQTGAVINLGTAFRSASVAEGLDDVVREEIRTLTRFVEAAKNSGVQIVLEGPGHIRLDQISEYWQLIENLGVPPMPLGPMVSDRYAVGDHVSSAIGAAQFMSLSRGGVINAVTSVEHRGGIPNFRQMQEGLQAAFVAAQAASATYSSEALREEEIIADQRAERRSCVLDGKGTGCSRCQKLCPLIGPACDVERTHAH